jgi:hypothetical protein
MAKLDSQWRPSFVPWISAVTLYMFLIGWSTAAAIVLPWLGDLWDESPRLAALGWLALFSSPIAGVAIGHHAAHGMMDRFDARKQHRRFFPGMPSVAAGFFGWFAIVFTSMATAFVMLAIFPPPPDESSMSALVRTAVDVKMNASIHTVVWIVICAQLYAIERAAAAKKQRDE